MPSFEELLGQGPQGVPNAAPAAPAAPDPKTFEAILATADPNLDTTKDSNPVLDRWQQNIFGRVLPRPENPDVGPSMQDALESFARTGLAALKAPGYFAESVQEYGTEKPFEPTWKAPVTSSLMIANKGLQWLEDELLPKPKADVPWYQDIDSAIGSAAAFIAGGAGGKALELSPLVTTAALGGSVGATSQYEEAVMMGADPEEAAMAYFGGAAFGMTEALSGTYFLNKINQVSGGRMYELLKTFNMSKESTPLREAIKSFLVEGGQEGFQTVGSNWIASDIAGYDPTRTLGENFWASVATGGMAGSMIGGGIGLIRKAETQQILDAMKAQRDMLLKSGNPINDLSGLMTPVGDLLELNAMKQQLDQTIATEAQAIFDDENAAGLGGFSEIAKMSAPAAPIVTEIPPEKQTLEYVGSKVGDTNDIVSPILSLPIEHGVETGIKRKTDGTPVSVREALQQQPVVVLKGTPYDDSIAIANKHIANFENLLKGPLDPAEEADIRKKLNILQKGVIDFKAKQKIANKILAHVKDYAASFREAINPDMKLVIQGVSFEAGKAPNGFFALTRDVQITPGQQTPVGALFINLDDMATEAFNARGAQDEFLDKAKRRVFEVVNHELGHSVAVNHMRKLFNTALQSQDPKAREEAYKVFAYIREDYARWLRDAASNRQNFIFLTQFAPGRAFKQADNDPRGMKEGTRGWLTGQSTIDEPFLGHADFKNYVYSFDEFFAEMTARLATQGKLYDTAMTKFFEPVLEQYKKIFAQFPEFAQNEYGKRWENYLRSKTLAFKVKQKVEELAAGGGKNIFHALRGKLPGYDPEKFAGLQQSRDRFTWGIDMGLNLVQMVQENPHISHWKNYLNAVELWQNYQRNFAANATEILTAWRGLGKVESAKLSEVLFDEAGDRKLLDPAELSKRLGVEGFAVYQQIRNQLNFVLTEMEGAAVRDAQVSYYGNKEMLNAELAEIKKEFDKLRTVGYFPFIRYGKYTITARAKEPVVFNGEAYKVGQLITFPVFENQKDRDDTVVKLKRYFGNKATVASSVMAETENVIQGMPRALLRSLRAKLEATGAMTEDQRRAFDKALQDTAPFRNFKKHFLRKRHVHGYSEDAIRSFATYMSNAAGHISKVKYAEAMREPILGMQEDVEIIKEIGGRADERQKMKHWLDEHFKYIMNPENELAALRAVGFVAYLGFNIKSALVNFTQQFTTTLPYLSARYGDLEAIKSMTKAQLKAKDWFTNRRKYLDAMPDEKGVIKKPNDVLMRQGLLVTQGLHEGWIDQSLATELAIARSENNLDRGLYLSQGRRYWHKMATWSALPFHLVEKMNRLVTSFAAYELEYARTEDHAKSVLAAKQANWSTNYENARWNRPKFMRGKKSAALLFMNYVQNTVYFATHDRGATRYWLTMLLLAGMMGLPGAEDLEDLVDFAVTGMNKALGIPNPKFALRQELRENLEHLSLNPDIVMHGISQSSFGLGHIGELLGIPIPRFDLSGSIGAGDIVPGTGIPKMLQGGRAPGDVALEAAAEIGGASGNLVATFYKGLTSTDPDETRNMERVMPLMSVRNVQKALRYQERGGEFTRAGDPIATFDPFDLRDQLEIVGQGLGFTPTKVSQGWEREIAVMDAIQYYKVQQEALRRQFNWAIWNEDREAEADVFKAIDSYNENIPFPELAITGESIKASARSYLDSRIKSELGIEDQKKFQRLRERVQQSYPDPAGRRLRVDKDGSL